MVYSQMNDDGVGLTKFSLCTVKYEAQGVVTLTELTRSVLNTEV